MLLPAPQDYTGRVAIAKRDFADAIPDVRWHIFRHSSHVPHIEERSAYMALVQEFVELHDQS